jgi:DoxX-like family
MARKISYWVTTALVAAILALAAFSYLTSQPAAVQNFVGLRYPQYFRFILGVAKALAVVALLSPRLALVKEWAYAGLTFTWIGAFVSHTVARDGKAILPVVLLALLAVSYLTRPASRRLPTAAAFVAEAGTR